MKKEVEIIVDDSIELEDLERDTYIMLQMDNGEQIFGLFRDIDGEIVILKAKDSDDCPCLGWPLDRVKFWGFVNEIQ